MAGEYSFIGATGFVGGAKGDIDNIPVACLADGDHLVHLSSSFLIPYTYNSAVGGIENSPWLIAPDDAGGNERWQMVGMLATGFEASVAAGDPKYVFDIGGVDKFVIGVDDDDSDKWKLCVGAAIGTNTAVEIDSSMNVNVAAHDGSSVGLQLGGTLITATGVEVNSLDGITAAGTSMIQAADAAAQLALLSGYAGAAFDLNDQDLVNVNQLAIGRSVATSQLDVQGVTYLRNAPTLADLQEQLRIGRSDSDIRYHSIYSTHDALEATNYLLFKIHDKGGSPYTGQTDVLKLYGSGNVDILAHDGSTVGLKLGGTLVTASAAELNILDGVTGVTAAELSYIGDVTGLIQAQLDAKAPIDAPTFTTSITIPETAHDSDPDKFLCSVSGLVKYRTGAQVLSDIGAQAAGSYQPLDSDLTSLALLGTAADKIAYTTEAHTWAEAAITAAGRAILDDANAAAQCTTLGLGISDTVQFGLLGVGVANSVGMLDIDQPSAEGAKPCISLDQGDESYAFIRFNGTTSAANADMSLVKASDFPTPGTLYAWVKVGIWDSRAVGDGGIPDGHLWFPVYTTPH